METSEGRPGRDAVAESLYRVDSADPDSRLVDRASLSPGTVAGIDEVMSAMGRLRRTEQELADASLRYMRLNQTDMRALHYLIVAQNKGIPVTPGALALHLGISTASVTKMLDRLVKGGHVTHSPHPEDRRALIISITESSRNAAQETVGRQQARRFGVAARLTDAERDTVVRFLNEMAEALTLGPDAEWAHPAASGDAADETSPTSSDPRAAQAPGRSPAASAHTAAGSGSSGSPRE